MPSPLILGDKTKSAPNQDSTTSPLVVGKKSKRGSAAAASSSANSSANVLHESYEERKIQMAKTGNLVPALKQSSLKTPYNRLDRKGNQIGKDKKKFGITYIDQIEKKPLVQVHCVESFKKYNGEDPNQGDTPCCTIF